MLFSPNTFVFSISKNLKIKIYETFVFPVVLYGCETWSLILREGCMLRVFENRIPRQIFGPKREWRRLHNEELHSLYRSPKIGRMIKSRRADHVAKMKKKLSGKPTGKRYLGSPRHRWEGTSYTSISFKLGRPTYMAWVWTARIGKQFSTQFTLREDTTSMYLKVIAINWVDLAEDRNYWSLSNVMSS